MEAAESFFLFCDCFLGDFLMGLRILLFQGTPMRDPQCLGSTASSILLLQLDSFQMF